MADAAARRTSADALLAMVLLVILYHAGGTFWQSRSLTLVGSLVPAVVLGLAMHSRKRQIDGLNGLVAAIGIGALLGATLLIQLTVDNVRGAYVSYAVANVAAQLTLTGLWVAWMLAVGDRVAILGTVLAAIGTGLATAASLHMAGAPLCAELVARAAEAADCIPAPWDATWENGPTDVLSRIGASWMLKGEAAMAGLAICTWIVVRVPPFLSKGLR